MGGLAIKSVSTALNMVKMPKLFKRYDNQHLWQQRQCHRNHRKLFITSGDMATGCRVMSHVLSTKGGGVPVSCDGRMT